MAEAALKLFAEQGFEPTTGQQIASRAGLTERTFYRHFDDKRDVLFTGAEALEAAVVQHVADASDSASPAALVRSALAGLADGIQHDRDRARLRGAIIAGRPELRERERTKLARIEAALARSLQERGVAPAAARLLAGTGLAVFSVAFDAWLAETSGADLRTAVTTAFDDLSEIFDASRPA